MKIKNVIFLLILFLILSTVKADGVPIRAHLTSMREDAQYALINVNPNNLTEDISLFLLMSTVGSEKENQTIIIPFETLPYYVDSQQTTSGDFLSSSGINGILDLASKQTLKDDIEIEEEMLLDAFGEFFIGSIFKRATFGAGAYSGVEYVKGYTFEGTTIDFWKAEKGENFKDFVKRIYGQNIPKELVDAIDKYGNHYIAIVNIEINPPISDMEYLYNCVPNTTNEIIKFVKPSPFLDGLSTGEINHFYRLAQSELADSGKDCDIKYIKDLITELVMRLSSKDVKGIVLNFGLELKENQVYYPLGTGAYWKNPIRNTQIVVKIPKEKEIELNPQMSAVDDKYRYYVWTFIDSNPNFDIKGKIKNASFLTAISDAGKKLVEFISYVDVSTWAQVWFIVILVVTWTISILITRHFFKESLWKYIAIAVCLSVFGLIFSVILVAPVSAFIAFLTDIVNKKKLANTKIVILSFIIWLALTLTILLIVSII